MLRRHRRLSEGRDFDDFGGLFPPERLRGQFGQRPGPMRRDDFPSPIALSDDRKGESPPNEIGPIPVDIQIGLIPAVAAMLRPDSSPIHNCSRAQSLSSGIRPPLTLESYLQSMEPAELWKRSWAEAMISSDPNFQRVIASPSSRKLFAVARSDISRHRRRQRERIDLNQAPINSSWVLIPNL